MKFIAPFVGELVDPKSVTGDSPRLKWIKANRIAMVQLQIDNLWHTLSVKYRQHGAGLTQDDALADWARKNKVRMWNEV